MSDQNKTEETSTEPASPNRLSSKTWKRLAYMVLFFVALELTELLVLASLLLQAVLTIIVGEPNENVRKFGRSLGNYARDLIRFLTFDTEEMPFPMKPLGEEKKGDA